MWLRVEAAFTQFLEDVYRGLFPTAWWDFFGLFFILPGIFSRFGPVVMGALDTLRQNLQQAIALSIEEAIVELATKEFSHLRSKVLRADDAVALVLNNLLIQGPNTAFFSPSGLPALVQRFETLAGPLRKILKVIRGQDFLPVPWKVIAGTVMGTAITVLRVGGWIALLSTLLNFVEWLEAGGMEVYTLSQKSTRTTPPGCWRTRTRDHQPTV